MGIVAILARRRVIVSGLERQPVNTGVKTSRLPRVTSRATHQRHRLVVIGMLGGDVRVATDTGIRLVRRQLELRLVHEQRNWFASGIGLREGAIAVTIEAITVFQTGGHRPAEGENTEQHNPNQWGENGSSVVSHSSKNAGE